MTVAPAQLAADDQAAALVAQIERKQAGRERELLAAAAAEAQATRQRARIKARRQLRRAIEELRADAQQRTLRLRAELETAARRQTSEQTRQALTLAWPQLRAAIERRWADPATRRCWLDAQLALARERLQGHGWLLRHPAPWSDAETAVLHVLLQRHGVADATLRADPTLSTGFVIEVDGARLDSTPQALLADHARVGAVLLAVLGGVHQ